ncbi:holin [Corynebacterium sp. TAE3-ERU2]|uniref:holin n=1 Tax=Corynebacterium sp. TAE3-ERU2 TaxID=2849497 RepID=UPI001C4580B5|nr:holin [Corynebacterium sp. TAE3-ERU2]MBV7302942.1 holin [Corynebacterium sp. TAE3-ERU2]
MFTKVFWMDATERAIKTFAQALIATLAVGTPILELDWGQAVGIAATATVVSLLTSIASTGTGQDGTASLVSATGSYDYQGDHRV